MKLLVRVSTYWFDLGGDALSLLISGCDRLERGRERERRELVM